MKGKWITTLKIKEVRIRKSRGWYRKIKDGFELQDYLIYWDGEFMWVAPPGYLWDGSSYPSSKSWIGRILRKLVGNRKKPGLLAASAQHDQMRIKSKELFMYYCHKEDVQQWQDALTQDNFDEFLKRQPMKNAYLTIRHAAALYCEMIVQWPEIEQTTSWIKAFKQYIGLLIFQPLQRLIIQQNVPWEKV